MSDQVQLLNPTIVAVLTDMQTISTQGEYPWSDLCLFSLMKENPGVYSRRHNVRKAKKFVNIKVWPWPLKFAAPDKDTPREGAQVYIPYYKHIAEGVPPNTLPRLPASLYTDVSQKVIYYCATEGGDWIAWRQTSQELEHPFIRSSNTATCTYLGPLDKGGAMGWKNGSAVNASSIEAAIKEDIKLYETHRRWVAQPGPDQSEQANGDHQEESSNDRVEQLGHARSISSNYETAPVAAADNVYDEPNNPNNLSAYSKDLHVAAQHIAKLDRNYQAKRQESRLELEAAKEEISKLKQERDELTGVIEKHVIEEEDLRTTANTLKGDIRDLVNERDDLVHEKVELQNLNTQLRAQHEQVVIDLVNDRSFVDQVANLINGNIAARRQ